MYSIGIGQDGHQFVKAGIKKTCIIAGVEFSDVVGLCADSDGDVVFHALCNALTCIHHVPILGDKALALCASGQKNSARYVKEALKYLKNQTIDHVSFTIEGLKPKMQPKIQEMRQSVAKELNIQVDKVGMVCTSGNGLTDCAKGLGVMATCVLISRRQA